MCPQREHLTWLAPCCKHKTYIHAAQGQQLLAGRVPQYSSSASNRLLTCGYMSNVLQPPHVTWLCGPGATGGIGAMPARETVKKAVGKLQ
jgi:hypothetical protein